MSEPPNKLNKSKRRLPHWELAGSSYFITFRLIAGEMAPAERQVVLDHIDSGDPKFYRLWAAVVMPDHVHLLLRLNPGVALPRVMKGIKGVSAKRVNDLRQTHGSLWQDESYDRIMRDTDEGMEKAEYLLANPVRAGLVEAGGSYPFLISRLG
ncbi:transposase [Phycisphaeraceae bacterium D3-23]